MTIAFTPDELRAIAEFVDHMQHAAPIPRPAPDHERLPVRVTILDGLHTDAVQIDLEPDTEPMVMFTIPTDPPTEAAVAWAEYRKDYGIPKDDMAAAGDESGAQR